MSAELDPSLEGSSRFSIVRRLGEGGMGVVYEVDDRVAGRRVALKVLKREGALDLVRFKREFRVAAGFHHPNLVRLLDLALLSHGRLCFTMELVDGAPLRQALHASEVVYDASSDGAGSTEPPASGAPTIPDAPPGETSAAAPPEVRPPPRARRSPACDLDALSLALPQMLDALEVLHAHGVVHRDLKPDNVMVDARGRVRVLDFGIVELVARDDALDVGMVRGTLSYMAPELLTGARATPASDLYALGCVVYQLVAGHVPFVGGEQEVTRAHFLVSAPRLDALVDGLPDGLSDAVHGLLAKDPAKRPTISEVRARLGLSRGGDASLRTSALVGREAELGALREALAAALSGEPQLVLIEGESGVGKTALAEALCREFDGLVLGGRCYEREALPFRALDPCMDELALHLRARPPRELAAHADDLGRAAVVFGAFAMLRPRGVSLPSDVSRAEAFQAVARIVRAAAERRPILFLVDDLQWTDPESVELVRALLGPPRAGRVLFVGMCRPITSREHPAASLRALPGARHVPLRPLERAATLALLDALLGAGGAAAHEALAAQSGGSPLFVRQLALALAARPALAEQSAAPTLEELVRARVAALSGDARAVLELAAVAGGVLDDSLLDAAGVSGPVVSAVDEALGSGLMTVAFVASAALGHRQAYDVAHDSIRERVYADLPEERRRALHARALARLDETAGSSPDARLRHAEAIGDAARVGALLVEAADLAAARLSYEHAARLYRRALESAVTDDPVALADLHLSLAHARHGLSDYPAVKAHTRRALELLGVRAPPVRLIALDSVRLALGHVARELGLPGARAAPAEVEPRLRAARALEHLTEVYASDHDHGGAVHALLQMLEVCEACPPSPELARAEVALALPLAGAGLARLASRYLARADARVETFDDPAARATVALHGALVVLGLGEWSTAHARMAVAREGFAALGADERVLHVRALELYAWLMQGETDVARAEADELVSRAARFADPMRLTVGHLTHAVIAAREGALDDARRAHAAVDEALGAGSHATLEAMRLASRSLLLARAGDAAGALALVDRAFDAVGAPLGYPLLLLPLGLIAETTRAVGARLGAAAPRARRASRWLRAFAACNPIGVPAWELQRAALATGGAAREASARAFAAATRLSMRHEAALARAER